MLFKQMLSFLGSLQLNQTLIGVRKYQARYLQTTRRTQPTAKCPKSYCSPIAVLLFAMKLPCTDPQAPHKEIRQRQYNINYSGMRREMKAWFMSCGMLGVTRINPNVIMAVKIQRRSPLRLKRLHPCAISGVNVLRMAILKRKSATWVEWQQGSFTIHFLSWIGTMRFVCLFWFQWTRRETFVAWCLCGSFLLTYFFFFAKRTTQNRGIQLCTSFPRVNHESLDPFWGHIVTSHGRHTGKRRHWPETLTTAFCLIIQNELHVCVCYLRSSVLSGTWSKHI